MIESDVRFYDILNDRTDASFYNDRFISFIDRIKSISHKPLYKLADFSSENWNQKDYFDDYFPYIEISAIDIQDGTVIGINNVEKTKAPSRAKKIVRKNDIIVSITRPNRGAICFVQNIKDIVIASTGFAVIRNINDDILREYLFIMLRQSSSLLQMEQRSSGGNYPAITEDELKKILIPLPPIEIQQQIVDLYNRAAKEKQAKEQEAKDLLANIDGYLLKELGIELPEKISKERYYEVNAMDLIGGRIDAIYYSPSFLNFYKRLEKVGCINLGSLIGSITNGFDFREYTETGTPYIKVANVRQSEFDFSKIQYVTFNSSDITKQIQLKKGNILLTRKGTFGNALYLNNNYDYVISSEVFNLDIKQDKINAKYLEVVLNSQIGQIQFDRNKIGAIMGSLSQEAVKQIKIPMLPKETQQKIVDHFQSIRAKAKMLQEEATEVLEKAKKQIEKQIITG